MARFSTVNDLFERYNAEDDARFARYMSNMRAHCRRSGGYKRYRCESRYFERRNKKGTPLLGRVFYHLQENLYPQDRIYTVRNGKVVDVREKLQ